MYERSYVKQIIDQIVDLSIMSILAITGPRQVGKTTIALQAGSRLTQLGIPWRYISLDQIDSDVTGWPVMRTYNTNNISHVDASANEQTLIAHWEKARSDALQSKQGFVLFLDEIQTIPRWSNIVKGLWDTDRRKNCPLRIVILGSAAWRMLTGLNESLLGRFDEIQISHWSFYEVAKAFGFTVDEYIFLGGYPGALRRISQDRDLSKWKTHILSSIVKPAIERDIVGLQRVRKPALMRHLVDLAPRYSGQIISYDKLLGHLQDAGNISTIARYLDLLSDAGLMTGFSRYTSSPHLGKASSPKLNVYNTAIMTAKSDYSFQEAYSDRPFWGRIVESAVGAHLLNTKEVATQIYYWRDRKKQLEVDYVIKRGPHLLGMEVKTGNVSSHSGLEEFETRFPHAKTMIVGPGGVPFNEYFSFTANEWVQDQCE
ncbi:MAG: ATP-binding protein [Bacteroidetes bacterium]|nr:ATP-binding protein [Bacteroidota bacterium]MCY4206312.1 ATP-binding protein [Bacteroidota bacterium]